MKHVWGRRQQSSVGSCTVIHSRNSWPTFQKYFGAIALRNSPGICHLHIPCREKLCWYVNWMLLWTCIKILWSRWWNFGFCRGATFKVEFCVIRLSYLDNRPPLRSKFLCMRLYIIPYKRHTPQAFALLMQYSEVRCLDFWVLLCKSKRLLLTVKSGKAHSLVLMGLSFVWGHYRRAVNLRTWKMPQKSLCLE